MFKCSPTSAMLLMSLLAVTALAMPGCAQNAKRSAALTLTAKGQPKAQIVIAANASPTEKYAAQELQRAIEKISGAQLPITSQGGASTRIVIGTPQSVPAIEEARLFNTEAEEETRVVRRGNTLFLAGKTPRVALYAVYTFLQETLGARWYWPGESGEYLPQRSDIAVNDLDITRAPTVPYRSLSINDTHYDLATATWMARNFLNFHNLEGDQWNLPELQERGFKTAIIGHNAYLEDDVLAAHPEYVAEVAGKREKVVADQPPHICWGNERARAAFVQKMAGWWNQNPMVDTVGIYGPDHMNFCECGLCKAYAPDVSTRWQKFCADVIAQLDKTHPGKKYQTLAYQSYRDVPTEVAPLDLNGYTTYNINYTKPITDASSSVARQEIEAWKNLGGQMGLRGYQFIIFNEPMYVPQTGIIMDEAEWAHTQKLRGWTSEVYAYDLPRSGPPGVQRWRTNWATNRMALYAVAQTLWNPAITTDDVLADWTKTIYGPAAAPMLAYHQMMEKAWRENKTPLTYALNPPAGFASTFISEALLKNAEESFQQARLASKNEKNAAASTRGAAQIELEAAMLDNWRQVLFLQQGRAAHFQAYAARVATKPQMTAKSDDPAWKNAASLPPFENEKGNAIEESTKALLLWDKDALYLRFISRDADIAHLRRSKRAHDANIFSDDGIEIFLEDKTNAAHYFHLMANVGESRYDAKADGAMGFDKSWNPNWTAKVSTGKDQWIMDLKLPFSSFGVAAKEGASWKMSIKRSGAEKRSNTGWPDASYHNLSGLGTVTLVDKVPLQKRVLIYNGANESGSLPGELARLGFTVKSVEREESEFAAALSSGVDAVVLRASGGPFALSDAFLAEKLRAFAESGGLLFVSAGADLPLEKWFGAEATARWDGEDFDIARKTIWHQVGNWMAQPNDLKDVIGGITPVGGYSPIGDGWEILAKSKTASGAQTSYLMRRKIGRGTLVLTSSAFSFSGGYEMFGNLLTENAAKLLDNLLADHRAENP